jgi:hypothetical protein
MAKRMLWNGNVFGTVVFVSGVLMQHLPEFVSQDLREIAAMN